MPLVVVVAFIPHASYTAAPDLSAHFMLLQLCCRFFSFFLFFFFFLSSFFLLFLSIFITVFFLIPFHESRQVQRVQRLNFKRACLRDGCPIARFFTVLYIDNVAGPGWFEPKWGLGRWRQDIRCRPRWLFDAATRHRPRGTLVHSALPRSVEYGGGDRGNPLYLLVRPLLIFPVGSPFSQCDGQQTYSRSNGMEVPTVGFCGD